MGSQKVKRQGDVAAGPAVEIMKLAKTRLKASRG
jgi:hypothetical protein